MSMAERRVQLGRRMGVTGVVGVALTCLALGCSRAHDGGFSYADMPVATGTAQTGTGHSVTMRGNALSLAGKEIAVGTSLADVELRTPSLAPVKLEPGKVRIISVVPSLDTPVCEQQTHYLSERNDGLDDSVELVTVSLDTPFAQGRFAKEAGIENVTFLSDNRNADFGRENGLLVEGPHILARAVMVVDAKNVIRYLQVTPELTELPDMEAAFKAARELLDS